MIYLTHMKANLVVAIRALLLCLFHILHALIPCRFTEHKYWGINLEGAEELE